MKKNSQKEISYLLPDCSEESIDADAKWRLENGFFQKHICWAYYKKEGTFAKITLKATDLQITLISLKYKIVSKK